MSLNIKDPHVHDLARRAAQMTGRSQVRAVEFALERLLGDDLREQTYAETMRRARAIQKRWTGFADDATIRSDHDLYDPETGLPA